MANEGSHEGLAQPVIIVLRHPHLLSHDLRGGHGAARPKRRYRVRQRAGGSTHRRRRRGRHSAARHSPRRRPLDHPQPQRSLHPARGLRHHLVRLSPVAAAVAIVVRVERKRVTSTEPRRRPARREEDLVRRFPHLVGVQPLQLPERPFRLVADHRFEAARPLAEVQTGRCRRRVGLAAAMLTHAFLGQDTGGGSGGGGRGGFLYVRGKRVREREVHCDWF